MKTIEIVGDNYFGEWNKTRTACRGIVVKEGNILMSYATLNNQWMIPGGGLEENESEKECCIREIAEETGVLVEPSECLLEIDEYYEDWKWVNKYFVCKVIGDTEINQTEREKEVGMEPRWYSLDKIKEIFSKHREFAEVNEMQRGMYLREYTALTELT
jgi:ADP-ribose pyrophosphatase YjhB (NUDIX family)